MHRPTNRPTEQKLLLSNPLVLTIAANKDEGEGITANITGIRLEEDGLMVAAVHAAGVLQEGLHM